VGVRHRAPTAVPTRWRRTVSRQARMVRPRANP
jgi:hypothetical protein